MALTLRLVKGSELTYAELDGNFTYLSSSFLSTASFNSFTANASITGSLNGTATNALTASYVDLAVQSTTASYALTASYVNLAVQSTTASYALTASYIDTANITANNITVANNIAIGTSGTINGQNILTSADTSQFVTSVNGIVPTAGNVSVSLTAVLTGTSASLVASSSGALTGSLPNGVLWVVSGDATPANNGDAYIFQSGSVGQWLTVAPFDTAIGDTRYVLQYGDGAVTGSFIISGSGITVNLKGNTTISGSLKFNSGHGLYDTANNLISVDPNDRMLFDVYGNAAVNWDNYRLTDSSGVRSIDWENRVLIDNNSNDAIDWNNREYYYLDGATAISLGIQDVIKAIGSTQITGSVSQYSSIAVGVYSHAEGFGTTSVGQGSHTEGIGTTAVGLYSHAEGQTSRAIGLGAHAEGNSTTAIGGRSHSEGTLTTSVGGFSHAEGSGSIALGLGSHAEGAITTTIGNNSHAEGDKTTSFGQYSHAEGITSVAVGIGAHAEGLLSTAVGNYSHAEGYLGKAIGEITHAEGALTTAVGQNSHAEGESTISIGVGSHAEGYYTTAKGTRSHTEGNYTIAGGGWSHVQGTYNLESSNNYEFIIGNGTSNINRSNLVYASGSQVQITGSLAVTGSIATGQGTIVLPGLVLASYADDTAAAAAGIPVGGLYRNGSFIQIRLI